MKRCPNCRASYPDQAVYCPADGAPLAAEVSADPFVGRVIDGKYQIEAALGEGGMGKVYRARHALLDRPVAVKVLHEAMRVDGRTAERFRREAQAAARLEHPNAVTIHDFGVTPEGNAYLVMELLKGISLRDMLIRRGRLPLDRAVEVIEQVGAAVDRAHQAGIVHRDLKPDNIMIEEREDGSWVAKVLDFGIAKLKDRAEAPSNLTATGTVLGTVAYMSPEQCRGTEIDGRSDIYSLGIVLYEMVTGRVPFSSATPSAIVAGHVSDTPPPPSAYQPDLPPEIERVILSALSKRPEDRPQTAVELARRFRGAAAGHGDGAPTVAIRGATSRASDATVPVFAASPPGAPLAAAAGTRPPEPMPPTAAVPHGHPPAGRPVSPVVWVLVGALVVAIGGAAAAVLFGILNARRADTEVPVTSGPAAPASPTPGPPAGDPAQPTQPAGAPTAKAPDPLAPEEEPAAAGRAPEPATPPAPAPEPDPAPARDVDRDALTSETRTFLTSWTRSIEARDVEANLGHYADTVDYYRAGPVPKRRIAADRARAFARFDTLRIAVTRIHSIRASADGQHVTVVFDKAWDFTGRAGASNGVVREQIVLARQGADFKIVSERDLVAY